eukprot:GSMAST32.ASY1.ANO1.1246.1 assembled CDS
MIIATEIGDKTFFIAAIMAMRQPRLTVFAGAIGALAVMTILSVAMGFVLPSLIPRQYTHYLSVALFVLFGYKMLKDAFRMQAEGTGLAEMELKEHDDNQYEQVHKNQDDIAGMENGGKKSTFGAFSKPKSKFLRTLLQAFTLTFLAEWGDRSQIATIALAAAKDPFGVIFGGIIGHSLCTGLAVLGGKLLASRISERTIAFFGGTLFMLFALYALIFGPE